MQIIIEEERAADFRAVASLTAQAFAGVKESDHREQFLIERLRRSEGFIPQLSLVARTDQGETVGYALLTKVEIVAGDKAAPSLAVAPLAVRPDFQRQGIGGMLLKEAHRRAASLGYGTAVLLGHKDYYPRFGYRKASDLGIEFPFDAPREACMIVELLPGATEGLHGRVRYPAPFFEE